MPDLFDLLPEAPVESSSGFFAAKGMASHGQVIALFGSRGQFIRTIGNAGTGPGEFNMVSAFGFGPGDSLWILDSDAKANVFAPPPSASLVRSFSFGRPVFGKITVHGILVPALYMRGEFVPSSVLDWSGKEVTRFRVSSERQVEKSQLGPLTLIGVDELWMGHEDSYELALVNSRTGRRHLIKRDVDWFRPGVTITGLPWIVRPPARLTSLSQNDDGALWVLCRRANRRWSENVKDIDPGIGSFQNGPMPTRVFSSVDFTKLFEAVLEVIDPTTGNLLAALELGGGVLGFVRPGLIFEARFTHDDEIELKLLTLRLNRID